MTTLTTCGVVAILVTGCASGAPEPPQGLPTVIDGMEYLSENSAMTTLGSQFDEYIKNVNLAFGQADAIAFLWTSTDANLSGFWPDVDDPTFGQVNRQTYIDFARNHRNAGNNRYPFGTFVITGPTLANMDCSQPHTLGLSGHQLNAYSADARDRFSYIFVDRIDRLYNFSTCFNRPGSQFNYPRDNVYVHIFTHEVGHQRAGLTHPDEPGVNPTYQSLYHQGTTPSATSNRVDVMFRNVNTPDLDETYPIFDQDYYPFADYRTCANNLHRQRVVPVPQ